MKRKSKPVLGSNKSDKSKNRKKKFSVDINGTSDNVVNGSSKPRRPLSLARLGEHFRDKDNESMEVDDNSKGVVNEKQSPVTPRSVTKEPSTASASSNSSSSSKKSRIPVRSNSCRLPKQLSFGAGVPRGFTRAKPRVKDWHTCGVDTAMDTVTSIETADMRDLKDSLPV